MFQISNITKKDFLEILDLLKKCNLDFQRNISDLEKAQKISDIFLVCKNERKNVIGTVRAIFDGCYCMLFDLAVESEFRNQGIGELLMREAEKRLKKQGAKYVFLNSTDEAVKFYEKIGYTKPKTNPMIKNFKKNIKYNLL